MASTAHAPFFCARQEWLDLLWCASEHESREFACGANCWAGKCVSWSMDPVHNHLQSRLTSLGKERNILLCLDVVKLDQSIVKLLSSKWVVRDTETGKRIPPSGFCHNIM